MPDASHNGRVGAGRDGGRPSFMVCCRSDFERRGRLGCLTRYCTLAATRAIDNDDPCHFLRSEGAVDSATSESRGNNASTPSKHSQNLTGFRRSFYALLPPSPNSLASSSMHCFVKTPHTRSRSSRSCIIGDTVSTSIHSRSATASGRRRRSSSCTAESDGRHHTQKPHR